MLHIEVAYLAIETSDPIALGEFLGGTIGLVPGPHTPTGESTWRNDSAAQRVIVGTGPADDAVALGLELADPASFATACRRLADAGFEPVAGTPDEVAARRVAAMAHVTAPWGTRIELVHGLERGAEPFEAPLFPGGFVTNGMGFGHVVFGTTDLPAAHRFVTDGLGMAQSDWIETELAPGIPLEVRFYHGNPRHHSIAVAHLPFTVPKVLHHVMFETNTMDDTGRAFDRALSSGRPIANSIGKHDNDEMTSFYVVSPTGFQVEVGHGARTVGPDWNDNRRYELISRWGHQPIPAAAS